MCLESDRPDGQPQSGVAHGFSMVPVSGVGVVVHGEKTEGNGVEAGFHARVVLGSDAFRLGVLGEVDDVLSALGVDRVVPIVLRVLVSW